MDGVAPRVHLSMVGELCSRSETMGGGCSQRLLSCISSVFAYLAQDTIKEIRWR